MIWRVVRHGDLLLEDKIRIACLKDQHWPHGIESQILWMNANATDEDLHLLGEVWDSDSYSLKAYMTLVNVVVSINHKEKSCVGVGSVCIDVDSLHRGFGRALMKQGKELIESMGREGILLCKTSLVPFYEKCGWGLLNYQTASVAKNRYVHCIMVLGPCHNCSDVMIDKNF